MTLRQFAFDMFVRFEKWRLLSHPISCKLIICAWGEKRRKQDGEKDTQENIQWCGNVPRIHLALGVCSECAVLSLWMVPVCKLVHISTEF